MAQHPFMLPFNNMWNTEIESKALLQLLPVLHSLLCETNKNKVTQLKVKILQVGAVTMESCVGVALRVKFLLRHHLQI